MLIILHFGCRRRIGAIVIWAFIYYLLAQSRTNRYLEISERVLKESWERLALINLDKDRGKLSNPWVDQNQCQWILKRIQNESSKVNSNQPNRTNTSNRTTVSNSVLESEQNLKESFKLEPWPKPGSRRIPPRARESRRVLMSHLPSCPPKAKESLWDGGGGWRGREGGRMKYSIFFLRFQLC